MTVRKLEKE
jgi:hypothetical protein